MGIDNETIKNQLSLLNGYREVHDIIEKMPLFFMELHAHDDELQVVRYPTKMKLESGGATAKAIRKHLPLNYAPNYVDVRTLVQSIDLPSEFSIQPSNLQIESSGYWKNLPMDKVGADKSGNPVQGKTWVESQKSWYEGTGIEPKIQKPISIEIVDGDAIGFIYVLRNAQHPRNTFKIGFTTKASEKRAQGLAATSGQPDGFEVVQDWKVKNPRAIEREVHLRLKAHRVNKNREFFRLNYKLIRECVEKVITEAAAEIA